MDIKRIFGDIYNSIGDRNFEERSKYNIIMENRNKWVNHFKENLNVDGFIEVDEAPSQHFSIHIVIPIKEDRVHFFYGGDITLFCVYLYVDGENPKVKIFFRDRLIRNKIFWSKHKAEDAVDVIKKFMESKEFKDALIPLLDSPKGMVLFERLNKK